MTNQTHRNRLLSIATGLSLLLGLSSTAHASSVDELESDHQALESQLTNHDQTISSIRSDLDKLSRQIKKLKKGKGSSTGIIQNYRLQSLLQQAQLLSERLQAKTSQKRSTENTYRQNRAQLLHVIEKNLEALRTVITSRVSPVRERKNAAKKFEHLAALHLRLLPDNPDGELTRNASALMGNGDGPEEISERITAITDYTKQALKEQKTIKKELAELKKTRFIRAEISHLLEEEAFFGERSFIRGGPDRQEQTETTGLGRTAVTTTGTGKHTSDGGEAPPTDGTSSDTTESSAVDGDSGMSPSDVNGNSPSAIGDLAPNGVDSSIDVETSSPGLSPSNGDLNMGTLLQAPAMNDIGDGSPSALTPLDSPVLDGETGARSSLSRMGGELGEISDTARAFSPTSNASSLSDRIEWLVYRLSKNKELVKRLRTKSEKLKKKLH